MEAKEFIDLLNNHEKVKDKSVEELKKLSQEFPYSQPVQLLYTIRLGQSSEYLFNRQLGKTSILTNDRTVLFDMFEREEDNLVETPPAGPVIREIPSEPIQSAPAEEQKPPAEDKERLEHSLLNSLPSEEATETRTEQTQEPQISASSGDEQSLKDKVKSILEENRRLREKYEGSQKEQTAINRRISEIKDRLDKIKEKQELLTDQPTGDSPATEVPKPEPKEHAEPGPVETSEVKEDISADEEAMIMEKDQGVEAEAVDHISEAPLEESAVSEQEDKEAVFTIDEESAENQTEGEEYSFSGWLHRLSASPEEEEPQEIEEPETNRDTVDEDSPADEALVVDETPEKDVEPEERPALTAKFELFDSFVEKLPELKRRKPENVMNRRQEEDLSDEESSLVTETLAKVYVKQKHYDKAIKAYEILRLKYPEKSGFFADRIFEIKKLVNS